MKEYGNFYDDYCYWSERTTEKRQLPWDAGDLQWALKNTQIQQRACEARNELQEGTTVFIKVRISRRPGVCRKPKCLEDWWHVVRVRRLGRAHGTATALKETRRASDKKESVFFNTIFDSFII